MFRDILFTYFELYDDIFSLHDSNLVMIKFHSQDSSSVTTYFMTLYFQDSSSAIMYIIFIILAIL